MIMTHKDYNKKYTFPRYVKCIDPAYSFLKLGEMYKITKVVEGTFETQPYAVLEGNNSLYHASRFDFDV